MAVNGLPEMEGFGGFVVVMTGRREVIFPRQKGIDSPTGTLGLSVKFVYSLPTAPVPLDISASQSFTGGRSRMPTFFKKKRGLVPTGLDKGGLGVGSGTVSYQYMCLF